MSRTDAKRRECQMLCAALAVSVLLTGGMALYLDIFMNQDAVPLALYWPIVGFCSIPAIPALWRLRKLPLWFAFGVWTGTLLFLHWMPYNAEKAFFVHAHRVHSGMSLDDLRTEMRGYREDVRSNDYSIRQRLSYQWDPHGDSVMDALYVDIENRTVIGVQIGSE
jgi:hypothetical protein